MRIALLQLDQVVGDLAGNASRIRAAALKAADLGADLCLTPELALSGYPPRDLLLSRSFLDNARQRLETLAGELASAPPVLVGAPLANDPGRGRPARNAAVLLAGGATGPVFHKTLLPTYDVFDEDRYFEPGPGPGVLELDGRRLAVTICEDLWNDTEFWRMRRYSADPLETVARSGADVLLNLSASPFTMGKQSVRQDMLSRIARRLGMPVCYANQAGGNDELVFAGRSMAYAPDGSLMARARGFAEDILVVDLESPDANRSNRIEDDDFRPESEAWRALVLGTRDYAAKCGFSTALVGLSGGVDSSLTLAVAAEALGPSNVLGVLMPSPYSSAGSITDAQALATNLDVKTYTLPIEPAMRAFEHILDQSFCDYVPGDEPDVTAENIQSRIRGNLLMALSNKYKALLLTTGNKSELAVGYCTIYGDMSGGLAVISDVPKTLVYRICRWLNVQQGDVIPESVLDKPPSAELRPGQTDQDSLPPYEVLDPILEMMVVKRLGVEEIVAAGFEEHVVGRVAGLVKGAEFKRRQAAPGIKITDRAFGAGWRMPIANRYAP